jgi:hypothetical protein
MGKAGLIPAGGRIIFLFPRCDPGLHRRVLGVPEPGASLKPSGWAGSLLLSAIPSLSEGQRAPGFLPMQPVQQGAGAIITQRIYAKGRAALPLGATHGCDLKPARQAAILSSRSKEPMCFSNRKLWMMWFLVILLVLSIPE